MLARVLLCVRERLPGSSLRGRITIEPSDGLPGRISSNVPARTPRLWVGGRLRLRLIGPDGSRIIAIVDRPFAVIGRSTAADLPIRSADASSRHVYLHVDYRGVFGVDLASRTGTRFDGAPAQSRMSWIRPGGGLELAGHRVELLESFPGPSPGAGVPPTTPLDEEAGLCRLDLVPENDPGHPLSMLSTLSFLGRSRSCAVRVDGDGVARVHGAVVRSASEAFLLNLSGPGLMINGGPAALASPIRDGDRLGLGLSRFVAKLRAPSSRLALGTIASLSEGLPTASPAEVDRTLRAVRDGQDELIRTNDQFQQALIAVVRQLYQEQSTLFERHLDRLDRLQQEMAELKAELRGRLGPQPRGLGLRGSSPPLPSPEPPPLEVPRGAEEADSGRATSWLIDRLGELEEKVDQETRSSWRDLISRLGPPSRDRNGG